MTEDELTALIHAELDGELSGEQRAELARVLLADPRARALRDELRDLGSHLDGIGQVEPPADFKNSILNRLPSMTAAMRPNRTDTFGRWRLAAMAAGLLAAGTIVYQTMQGTAPGSRETAGTMAADTPTRVDSAVVGGGPVTGRATLYRDRTGLAVELELSAAEPVDVLIEAGSRSFRINGLVRSGPAASARRTVALRDVGMQGQSIELSFLIGEHTVSRATLRAPSSP